MTKNDTGLWSTGMKCYVAGWYQSDCEYGGDPCFFRAGDTFTACPYCDRPVSWNKRLDIQELQQPEDPPVPFYRKVWVTIFRGGRRIEQPKREYLDHENVKMKEILLSANDKRLWCCGKPVEYDPVSLGDVQLDHIIPKKPRDKKLPKGYDKMYNRAPACSIHNRRKSNRDISYFGLRREIMEADELDIQISARRTGVVLTEHEIEMFLHSLVNPEWAHHKSSSK